MVGKLGRARPVCGTTIGGGTAARGVGTVVERGVTTRFFVPLGDLYFGASQGSDGLHEEYGIDALMALYDPKTIRIDERTKANRATINGVDLLPMSKTLEMGRKIVELRTKLTVDAINKAIAQ